MNMTAPVDSCEDLRDLFLDSLPIRSRRFASLFIEEMLTSQTDPSILRQALSVSRRRILMM